MRVYRVGELLLTENPLFGNYIRLKKTGVKLVFYSGRFLVLILHVKFKSFGIVSFVSFIRFGSFNLKVLAEFYSLSDLLLASEYVSNFFLLILIRMNKSTLFGTLSRRLSSHDRSKPLRRIIRETPPGVLRTSQTKSRKTLLTNTET